MPGDAPNVPSAMEDAQAQIALERERAKLNADRAAADKAAADAEQAQKVAKATGQQETGYNAALEYAGKQTGNRGYDQGLVDQYGVGDIFKTELDRVKGGLAEDDIRPQFGEKTLYDDAVATGTDKYRTDLSRQFDQFAGDGFSSQAFSDTADDDILNSILGTQYGDVLSKIDASKARGTLNDSGYAKAIQKLEEQKKAGGAQIQNLGQGVLSGYRNQLDTTAGNSRAKLGNASFDNPFDIGGVQSQLDSLRGNLSGRLEGDLYNATSGQSFFDPSSILSYGSSSQGMFNPSKQGAIGGDNPLLTAFTDKNKTGNNPLSTTGNNGAF
ncbi:MAG: hypothetical protein KKH61_21335 [Gammaproteobacteria bacterium]|uniref:Uncharacterized protein n=1 Tax=viral metagenome TaxID=1070528 RepID=A0A6H1ZB41_9ZZZZ|nr:hypothetical protein [Gammaproteobacteria bacterium]